jgi:O-antigen/teichoic acid export membrane protein
LCLIIGLFVSAALVSFRVPIIKIFSSPEYLAAAPAMAILAVFPVFLILTYLFHQILLLEKQKKTLIKGYVFAPLLNIALNFVLIPVFGIGGAAIATVVSYSAIFLFFLSKIKKYGILNLSRRFIFKLGVCLALSVAPLYFFHPGSIMELLFLAAASGIVYFASLIFLSVIGKEEFDILFPGLFKKNNRGGAAKPEKTNL